MATRALEETLARIDATRTRRKPTLTVVPQPGKGRPPPRQRPADFEIIFIEIGRLACETFYRASRITVNRWLEECGKDRLIELRSAFVRRQPRSLGSLRDVEPKAKAPEPVAPAPPVDKPVDESPLDVCLAKAAAHFLRMPSHGGWRVSPASNGSWNVGMMRMSANSLIEYAASKGFSIEHASLSCEIEIERGNA